MTSRAINCLVSATRTPFLQQTRNGSSSFSKKAPVTIDDLPVPKGSWEEHYKKKNQKYTLQLLVGSGLLSAVIGYLAVSDVFEWNFFPPELPKKE